ncbi:MAG: hypothetical protein AB7G06_09575 [Bdellovibrionales bacterium]
MRKFTLNDAINLFLQQTGFPADFVSNPIFRRHEAMHALLGAASGSVAEEGLVWIYEQVLLQGDFEFSPRANMAMQPYGVGISDVKEMIERRVGDGRHHAENGVVDAKAQCAYEVAQDLCRRGIITQDDVQRFWFHDTDNSLRLRIAFRDGPHPWNKLIKARQELGPVFLAAFDKDPAVQQARKAMNDKSVTDEDIRWHIGNAAAISALFFKNAGRNVADLPLDELLASDLSHFGMTIIEDNEGHRIATLPALEEERAKIFAGPVKPSRIRAPVVKKIPELVS